MRPRFAILAISMIVSVSVNGQSGRSTGFSESAPARIVGRAPREESKPGIPLADSDVIRVRTDLVTLPVKILNKDGRPVPNVGRNEFKIFENGIEQQVAYFSNDEQPFTVALVLDMSYSTVFKLDDIQTAARIFVSKLRGHDRVTVISFDERPRVLCELTNDRRVLRLAIDATQTASGTALYDALDMVVRKQLADIPGRRAIVLLSDGVDTSSGIAGASSLVRYFAEEDVIVYPIRYDTFDDVQKSRRKDAAIQFDEDDRAHVVPIAPKKGERSQDYKVAKTFLEKISAQSGGRVYPVSSATNLNDAFSNIANELRNVYSLGYYPAENRQAGAVYDIKVRVYRPDLKITTRNRNRGR